MAGETIVLDPTALGSGRTQLDITSYVAAAGTGIDWGDAEIQAYTATLTIGEVRMHYRLPNRLIKIPLALRTLGATTFATIRSSLQQKIGLIQREGGSIMRQVGATPLYADIQSATLHLGGAWLQAYRDVDVDAVLALECLPDWYGDEITLSDHVETTLPHLFFTEPVVNGNHPGRVRLVVDNDQSGQDQHGLLWGFRAQNYSGGTTAALFYEAEALTTLNGAAGTALSGASGGTVVTHATLPANLWVSMLQVAMKAGTTALTHTGEYRVWARCYSPSALPQYRLQWGVGDLAVPATNDPAQVAGTANFYLLDLGGISLDAPPTGIMQWQGVIQTQVPSSNQPAMIDSIYFQPLDEYAGRLTYTPTSPASSIEVGSNFAGTIVDDSSSGTAAWANPMNAQVYDNTFAAASIASGSTSHFLKATNWFAIPAGATVKGIEFHVYLQWAPGPVPTARLVKAGTNQTTGPLTAIQQPFGAGSLWAFGGPTDLWGGSWLATDINNSGFGAAILFSNITGITDVVSVDFLQMFVWYTLASGFTVSQDAVAYNLQSVQLGTTGMYREDPTGTVYGPVSNVIGDLPRIPPSGLEGGTIQTFLKLTRGDFNQLPDAGIDDCSARIFYRPSYLITP